MNTFELEIWDDEGEKCTFYTVRKEDATLTETDKFFTRYDEPTNELFEHADQLLMLIQEVIGDTYGAIDDFFDRHESKAQALPPKPKKRIEEIAIFGKDFPLRLYCLRLSESVVVLFNGGLKNEFTAQQSEDVSFDFREAQVFAQRILDALEDGMIEVSEELRSIIDFTGETDKILI